MKFLERFTLVVYSVIILILAVITSLLIFNWMDFEVVTEMVEALLKGTVSSKVTLGVCVVFILLSIKCMFFDEKSKQVLKDAQALAATVEIENELEKLKDLLPMVERTWDPSTDEIEEDKKGFSVMLEKQLGDLMGKLGIGRLALW